MQRSKVSRSALAFGCAALGCTLQAAGAETFSDQLREEIIVTASRVPAPAKAVGSTVTVLTAADIEARKVQLGSDLLREVPGVAVSRAGQVGAVTQARLRGAEGNHTLVLIDGIEANNPALGFEFNFADLLTYDIERIEVLRGPQSALYGSEAIGGVISITTRGGLDRAFVASGEMQAGAYGTRQLAASIGGGGGRASAHLSATDLKTDGISSSAIQPERDGYETTTVHAKLHIELSDALDLRAVVRHADNEADFDEQDFAFPATPTQGLIIDAAGRTESSQLYALVELDLASMDDDWLHTLRYSHVDTESEAFDGAVFDNGNEGERRKYEYEASFAFGSAAVAQSVTLGVQHESFEFENRFPSFPGATYTADDDQTSIIAEYRVDFDGLALSGSVRQDYNDRFDDARSFRVAAAYLFEATGSRLHTSYGEGITNPSFFELFGFSPSSFVGNPDLEPESSASWDIGVEQAFLGGRALVDLTYFDTNLQDEITTVFDFSSYLSTADNLRGESERSGVELSGLVRLDDAWQLRAAYTYLDAAEPDGDAEVRRPRHSASFNLNRGFMDGRANANLGVVYNGEQEDSEFIFATAADRVTLDAYTLVNVAVSYDVTERVQVFARGENLTDEDYTEVFGFRSPGRAGAVGVRARF